jgi:DNA-binding response OmpR family regulator
MIVPLPGGTTPRPRVLCVDDNPDIADSEAILLGLAGFEARPSYGGRDALALAETFRPRVCLLDMNMPGMDGDEVAAHLRGRAAGRGMLLIAVTAVCADATGGRMAWFDLHLFKPVEPEQLLAAVNSLCRAERGTAPAAPRPLARHLPTVRRRSFDGHR